jgi:hypothetical protein
MRVGNVGYIPNKEYDACLNLRLLTYKLRFHEEYIYVPDLWALLRGYKGLVSTFVFCDDETWSTNDEYKKVN